MGIDKQANKITKETIIGYSVHTFTAIGTIFAFLSLRALFEGRPRETMLWLFVTFIIDGIDGPISRKLSMSPESTRLDGYTLDLVVDYLTFILIPALFMWKFELFPPSISFIMTSLIIVTGAMWSARTDMKTDDKWFNGFPAAWNIIALNLWLLKTSVWLNVFVVVVFIVLCGTNVAFFHVVRSKQLRYISAPLTTIYLSSALFMISVHGQLHNNIGRAIIAIWFMYYIATAIWRTWF